MYVMYVCNKRFDSCYLLHIFVWNNSLVCINIWFTFEKGFYISLICVYPCGHLNAKLDFFSWIFWSGFPLLDQGVVEGGLTGFRRGGGTLLSSLMKINPSRTFKKIIVRNMHCSISICIAALKEENILKRVLYEWKPQK